ncbi:MAG: class I SAM-dependent methyltransferase [Alphaproteobacteria bacterium]
MRSQTRTPRRFVDRDHAILDIARGRRVLHLGCVGHADETPEERVQLASNTLHWKLTDEADTVGVDYSREVIDEYRVLGIFDNVIAGDVQRLEDVALDGPFDIVVAADIIEHLSSPGAMLDGIKRFCGAETRVVITTPHAFGLLNFIRFLLGRFRDGAEHVMTFNADNIHNLLERHGYAVERLDTCHQPHARRHGPLFTLGKVAFAAAPRLGGTLFVVARPVR